MDIKVDRITKLEGDQATKALVTISDGNWMIGGIRIVNDPRKGKGVFMSMPQHQGKDGRWYDSVHPITKEMHDAASKAVIDAYNK